MKKYIEIYTNYFNIGEQDRFNCEYCCANNGSEIHHIKYKSRGGNDEIENLIGLCKQCHLRSHNQLEPYITEKQLLKIIKNRNE